MSNRWHVEHLITATEDATGTAPTNAVALVAGEGGGSYKVARNATGVAGGLFDFGDAAFLTALGMSGRPLQIIGIGAAMGGQSVYSAKLLNKLDTVLCTIQAGTTAADFHNTDKRPIPPGGQVKFETTGMTGAGVFWLDVEEL